jgi:NADH-quinone oxidoreductase subunit M/multicomponent Na+:H+ antiporter subunit D
MAGTVNFAQISVALKGGSIGLWMFVALFSFIIGFGVKSAIVPLHTWLPDAHPEAPSPISAMLSGILIETALYGLTRILYLVYPSQAFNIAIAGLAVITMTFANITAVLQQDIKRMLAYSSIAQMGYMLVGVASGGLMGLQGVFLHVFNHSLMKGLAFLSAGNLIEEVGNRDIENLRGIAKIMPVTSFTMFIALLGLGGVPGTNGFISKYILFGAAIGPGFWWLTVIGVLNSALSMVYYLRIMKALVGPPRANLKATKEAPPLMLGVTVAMATLIILFGIWPSPIIEYATEAARSLTTNLPNYIKVIIP